MSIDQPWSSRIYTFTKASWILRPIAIFCATSLVFMMMTAVVFSCSPVDCDADLWRRVYGSVITLGFPLFMTWLVTFAMQKLVKRQRPFEHGSREPLIKMVWEEPSFPSAHAAIAFATAAVAWWDFAEVFGPWLFVVAFVVAISRVAVGVHYFSDVIFGALIGFAVGSASWFGLMWLFFLSPWH
ncbi:phosphatase PAP2 family protein [Candidatus Uhrbacteria bacterium]|nr:phosphatase PAP2 family protein [Candidatus Uhrbacteria bacterium]